MQGTLKKARHVNTVKTGASLFKSTSDLNCNRVLKPHREAGGMPDACRDEGRSSQPLHSRSHHLELARPGSFLGWELRGSRSPRVVRAQKRGSL